MKELFNGWKRGCVPLLLIVGLNFFYKFIHQGIKRLPDEWELPVFVLFWVLIAPLICHSIYRRFYPTEEDLRYLRILGEI